jgi:hypothetical protein
MLERQKGRQWEGDKLLPEIGQISVHKAHFLISEQHPKSNNTAKLKNNQHTITTH